MEEFFLQRRRARRNKATQQAETTNCEPASPAHATITRLFPLAKARGHANVQRQARQGAQKATAPAQNARAGPARARPPSTSASSGGVQLRLFLRHARVARATFTVRAGLRPCSLPLLLGLFPAANGSSFPHILKTRAATAVLP